MKLLKPLFLNLLLSSTFAAPMFALDPAEVHTRKEMIPEERLTQQDDQYLEGYIQALIDMHYYEEKVVALVHGGNVTLSNLPASQALRDSIICFVRDIPEVKSVAVATENATIQKTVAVKKERKQTRGTWFPQASTLFQPLIADPRQPSYSAAYRFNDGNAPHHTAAVSFGDEFPLYRWQNVGPYHGDMQLDLEGGIFSVFDVDSYSAPLVNTDFMVSLLATYAFDRWSFRGRITHISSHLGDEFLVYLHPGYNRLNPSRETIDFFASYQVSEPLRVYGGLGYVANSDKSYPLKPWYVEYGVEARLPGQRSLYNKLYGQPFFAMHFRSWQDFKWKEDCTVAIGYEWGKLQGTGRKVRASVEYHHGFSLEGQFSRIKRSYLSGKMAWGF